MRKYLLLLLTISAFTTNAQNFSNKGRDFWVAYGYHQVMNNGNGQQMVLYFATDQVTTVTVTIPGLGWTRTYSNIPANTVFTSDPMPKGTGGDPDSRLTIESSAPEDKGIHIVADAPIVAYSHIYNQNVSGASILFPSNTLGKEYYSINYKNTSNTPEANCWFYVIATDTGTTAVEITPSADAIGHPAAAGTFTITLTQGQIYNVMAEITSSNNPYTSTDLTGSKIKSVPTATGGCKRIGVFSGSGRISITCGTNSSSSDNYMVQAFPKDAWGKKFLTVPTSSLNNNVFRICVTDPTTIVTVNSAPIAVPLTNNFYYELPQTTQPLKIEGDQPIMVVQYIASQGGCGNPSSASNPGDPEVLYLSPVEQNIAKVIWNATPNFNILEHYFNVVVPNTGTAITSFRLDGAVLPPGSFTVHPQDPGFSYLSRATTPGIHTIQSDSGFNAIAYGFGSAESYGYNAGTNIRDLYNFISPLNPWSLVPDPVACTGTPFYYTVTFPFQPTSLFWDFHGSPFQTPNANVSVPAPVSDSTYFIGIKQVWRYKLPLLYSITPANSNPGYLITITAGTTSTEGCGNSVERDFYIAVYDPPVAKMDWFNNGCVSDSVRFRDTTTYLAGTYSYKWYWNFGDGSIDSVRYPTHKYLIPGTYTVKFAMISNVGCFSDTAIRQVTVTNIPDANISISTPICAGSSLTFTSNSLPPTGFGTLTKWYWDFGDSNTQTIVAPASSTVTHTYPNWGNVTPKLKVETNSGCQSLWDTSPMYVGPVPVANFILPGGLCLPADSGHFVNATTIADGNMAGIHYQWNFGDAPSGINNTSTLLNPVHYYNNAGPFNIAMIATSAEGCSHDTSKVLSTVYPQPISGFAVLPENCYNTTTSFTSSSSGSGHAITNWYWDFGDLTPIGSGQTTGHVYASPGTYTVKHWVKTNTNCYSDTMSQTVVVNPLPTVNFNYNTPTCENRTINFSDLSVANVGTLNHWAWNFDDPASGTLNTTTATNPQHSFSAPGTYAVELIVVNTKGCTDTLPVNVVVHSRPISGFINPEVCLSDTYAQFLDTSHVDGDNITQWLWNFDDASSGALNTSTVQNPQHSYHTIGTKNVEIIVTSSNGCKDTIVQSFFVNGDIPVAGISVQNASGLCANDSVYINNTSTVDVGSVIRVDVYWDNVGAPGVFTTDDFPYPGKVYSHKYPNFQSPLTKTYQIRFRAYSGVTCINDFFQDITINAAPKVQFNYIPDTCLNIAPFQITQATEIGGVPGTFVYSGQGVSSTGIFDPSIVGPGLYMIKYVYTSNMGCQDSGWKQIRILQPPTANFGFSTPSCETKAITFTDSCISPVGAIVTWSWDFGDATPPEVRTTNTPFTHTFATAGTYTVKLLVTTDDGCNSLVKTRTIIVHPQPEASFRFTDTTCLPHAFVQFTNTSTISDGTEASFLYLWSFGDPASGWANSSIAVNPSHVYEDMGPYTAQVRVTSGDGCIDYATNSVNTIHPQPKADFRFNKPSACIGDNVKFVDMSDPKDGSLNEWYWNFGDNGNAEIQNPTHTYASIGNYTASLYMINSFGCVSDTLPKVFSVYPYPVISAGPDQQVLEGENTILQATATGNDLEYLWMDNIYLNNNTIIRPTCAPVNDITYTLTVTGRGGCPTIDQVKIFVLKTPMIPNTFSPNNDGINDHWEIKYLKTYPYAKVQVFTRAGQMVFESTGYKNPWDGTVKGKPLPIDTYYYIIEPESGRAPVTGYVTIVK